VGFFVEKVALGRLLLCGLADICEVYLCGLALVF
jgi:hypothetical protein